VSNQTKNYFTKMVVGAPHKIINLRKEITIILMIKVLVLIGIKIAWFSDGIDAADQIDFHLLSKTTLTRE